MQETAVSKVIVYVHYFTLRPHMVPTYLNLHSTQVVTPHSNTVHTWFPLLKITKHTSCNTYSNKKKKKTE